MGGRPQNSWESDENEEEDTWVIYELTSCKGNIL